MPRNVGMVDNLSKLLLPLLIGLMVLVLVLNLSDYHCHGWLWKIDDERFDEERAEM